MLVLIDMYSNTIWDNLNLQAYIVTSMYKHGMYYVMLQVCINMVCTMYEQVFARIECRHSNLLPY